MSLHQNIFHRICLRWGTPEVDLLASRLNGMVLRFLTRSQAPLVNTADALVAPWGQYSRIYASPPLKILPRLLRRIKAEGIPVILVGLYGLVRLGKLTWCAWSLTSLGNCLSGRFYCPKGRSSILLQSLVFEGLAVMSQVLKL